MNLPKKLMIGQNEYKISKSHFVFNRNLAGLINYHTKEILIRKTDNDRDLSENLFHEIAHGLFKELEYNHPKITSFRNNEEFIQETGLLLRKIYLQLLKEKEVLK